MSKLKITVEGNGLKDLIKDLDKLSVEYPEILKQSFEAQQEVIEQATKDNWVSMVGGRSTDRVYESVGRSTKQDSGTNNAYGTVGVYKLDYVEAKHGTTEQDLTAAQIAYWVENGTTRLRSGARKRPGVEYEEQDLISVAAKPFIGNAYFRTITEQDQAFAQKWNELITKVTG